MLLLYFFVLVTVIFGHLNAILDGRIAPIVLDTRYTFTNYEFARGFVSFRDGFDLPPSGTILLQLDSNCPINNSIGLNNGTIIINNEITLGADAQFTGSGFLSGSAIQPSQPTIYFQNSLIFKGSYIKVMFTLAFRSTTWGIIDFLYGAALDARAATFLRFSNCDIIDRGSSILTTTSNPAQLVFSNCRIFPGLDQPTEWKCSNIFFQGDNELNISTQLKMNILSIINLGQVTIGSGSQLQLTNIDVKNTETRVFLTNSTLDFISTTTSPIQVGDVSIPRQGSIIVGGKATIGSSTGNQINISKFLTLEFLPGSRLLLAANNHLTVQ